MTDILRYRPLLTMLYATGGGGGGSGSLSGRSAGNVTVASGATSKVITFSSAMADTNYSIMVLFTNIVDATPQFQPITPTAISVNGFTATWNGGLDTANYVINYIVVANT